MFSFESLHGEAMLKMGWVVKKWIFSFWMALNWSKCILMESLYIWLSIYTNNEIICIIWKFDLRSRGVLGRIYALSIEVLSKRGRCLFPTFYLMTNSIFEYFKLPHFTTQNLNNPVSNAFIITYRQFWNIFSLRLLIPLQDLYCKYVCFYFTNYKCIKTIEAL